MAPWVSTPPLLVLFLLAGLSLGGLASALITAVPKGDSLTTPAQCGQCGSSIPWFDRIPALSFLALRGRCRTCRKPIPLGYLGLEVGCAVLFAVSGMLWGFTLRGFVGAIFMYLLMVLSAIDYECRRLPNPLVGTLAIIGGVGALASQLLGLHVVPLLEFSGEGILSQPLVSAVVGALCGAGISLFVAVIYARLRGQHGLGMGDVKLLGAIGLFLGPYTLFAYGLATLLGAAIGIVLVQLKPGTPMSKIHMPFGPMLAVASVVTALAGPAMWAWLTSALM